MRGGTARGDSDTNFRRKGRYSATLLSPGSLMHFASLKKFLQETGVSLGFRQAEHRVNHRNSAPAKWVPRADSSQGSRVCATIADSVFKGTEH